MKKMLLFVICLFSCIGALQAQEIQQDGKIKVYCEVMCSKYNLLKGDVNASVDFGLADKAKNAIGWIYNTETNKKMSFASPMSVFAYMAKKGWEYKDAIVVSTEKSSNYHIWHFILTKEVPLDYTTEDIIGDIDYRK